MNDIPQEIGLMRCEVRDVRAVGSNIDHCVRKQFEPAVIRRPGGIIAMFAARCPLAVSLGIACWQFHVLRRYLFRPIDELVHTARAVTFDKRGQGLSGRIGRAICRGLPRARCRCIYRNGGANRVRWDRGRRKPRANPIAVTP